MRISDWSSDVCSSDLGPSWRKPMAKAPQKITLSPSRDIPFDRLILSQSNVRRVKAGVSIAELAEDISRRTLLQSLNVRPVLDGERSDERRVGKECVSTCR